MRQSAFRVLVATHFGLALFGAAPPVTAAPQGTAPYDVLDNVEEPFFNLNAVPIRPMVLSADETRLFAVNTHDSAVVEFDVASATPTVPFRKLATPWAPVSIALWTPPEGADGRILVVCRGSYALASLNRNTGEIVDLFELPPEPADLLVNPQTNHAFVSCAGQDLVIEIDLVGPVPASPKMTKVRDYLIPSKNPQHMCFDESNRVLVAPLFSSNNSVVHKAGNLSAGTLGILDLDNPAVATQTKTLPDHDLFRLDPATGSVTPVARKMGTLLTGMGLNPVPAADGVRRFWQLNTEANNKNPAQQSEALISGEVVFNRLTIAKLDPGGAMVTPEKIIELDDEFPDAAHPGIDHNPTRTVGQPDGLFFTPQGFALLVGVLTDNVTILGPDGGWAGEFDVPDGSIPRFVFVGTVPGVGLVVYVYCWGTNKIEAYTSWPPIHAGTFDLGFDPTPQILKDGRKVFYDGTHSKFNNQSCHSCHPNGMSDLITWNISKFPGDDKGPLVTQTLRNIKWLGPMHWRGEQQNGLPDFMPAFQALLGSNHELTPEQQEQFIAFTLALRAPANPHQNAERLVDSTIEPLLVPEQDGSVTDADAVAGKDLFKLSTCPADNTCERCHNLPTGTSNEIQGTSITHDNPRRQRFEVAHFIELFRREQDADRLAPGLQMVDVELPILGTPANPLPIVKYDAQGVGVLHAGVIDNLHTFIKGFAGDPPDLDACPKEMTASLTAFVHQWDNAVGPAIHKAFLLDQATEPTVNALLTSYLKPQAAVRNCDIAVFGKVTRAGVVKRVRWFYDRTTDRFRPDDPVLPNQPLSYFITQAQQNLGSNVFVGRAVGTGEGFGIDFDTDHLINGLDNFGTGAQLTKDFDLDGDTDGHEFHNGGDPANPSVQSNDTTDPKFVAENSLWFTSEVAVLTIQTDEPTTVTVDLLEQTTGTVSQVVSAPAEKQHRIVLKDLLPSTPAGSAVPPLPSPAAKQMSYTGSVKITDLGGRTLTHSLPTNKFASFYSGLASTPALPIGTRNHLATELLVSNLQLSGTVKNIGAGTITTTVNASIVFEGGGPPMITPPNGAVAVFRVLKNGQVMTAPALSSADLKPLSVTTLSGDKLYAPPDFPEAISGPFLIDHQVTGGVAQVAFTLSGVIIGDVVTVNVEMLSFPAGSSTPSNPVALGPFFNLWSMPDTQKEKRALDEVF